MQGVYNMVSHLDQLTYDTEVSTIIKTAILLRYDMEVATIIKTAVLLRYDIIIISSSEADPDPKDLHPTFYPGIWIKI